MQTGALVRGPVRVSPPLRVLRDNNTGRTDLIEGGCLLCGIDHVDIDRERASGTPPDLLNALAWQTVQVPQSDLGAPGGPRDVRGVLCPTCFEMAEDTGGVFHETVQRLLTATLGLVHEVHEVERPMLTYASRVLAARRAAKPEPDDSGDSWAHLDLDEARGQQPRRVEKSLVMQEVEVVND